MSDLARPVHSRVGAFELVALLDAVGVFPLTAEQAFSGAAARDWDAARQIDPASMGVDGSWRLAFRSFAVRRPDGGVTMIDLGVGGHDSPAASWAPTPGHLPTCMRRASIDPADVDTVVFTHLHSDHVGWVLDPDNRVHFPSARHVVQRRELDELRSSDDRRAWERTVQPLLDHRLLHAMDGPSALTAAPADDCIEIFPTPGHTPGHQSVAITSQGRRAIVTGDVFVHAVQIANPQIAYTYEDSSAQAAAALDTGATLANPHLTIPYLQL